MPTTSFGLIEVKTMAIVSYGIEPLGPGKSVICMFFAKLYQLLLSDA